MTVRFTVYHCYDGDRDAEVFLLGAPDAPPDAARHAAPPRPLLSLEAPCREDALARLRLLIRDGLSAPGDGP